MLVFVPVTEYEVVIVGLTTIIVDVERFVLVGLLHVYVFTLLAVRVALPPAQREFVEREAIIGAPGVYEKVIEPFPVLYPAVFD